MFKHVVNVNEEGVIVIDYSRRKLHSDIYAAGDVSQADGHAGSQVHCDPHWQGRSLSWTMGRSWKSSTRCC